MPYIIKKFTLPPFMATIIEHESTIKEHENTIEEQRKELLKLRKLLQDKDTLLEKQVRLKDIIQIISLSEERNRSAKSN